MYVLLQSVHLLDAQTSQFASLPDEHCGSVSTTPCSVAGPAETHVPATSRRLVRLPSVHRLDGQTSQSASLRDRPCRSVPTTPWSVAGHAGAHSVLAKFKMEPPLQSTQLLDGQTSRHAWLLDKHCRSVSTTPCSVAGHAETLVPATSKMQVLLQSVQVLARAGVAACVATR